MQQSSISFANKCWWTIAVSIVALKAVAEFASYNWVRLYRHKSGPAGMKSCTDDSLVKVERLLARVI